jgi:hypothetical protein
MKMDHLCPPGLEPFRSARGNRQMGHTFLVVVLVSASWQTSPAQSAILSQWPGMSDQDDVLTPDPHGAAGPRGVIATVNLSIAYYSKSGAFIWGPVNMQAFWAGVGNTGIGISDPKAVFDPASGRFFVILRETITTATTSNSFLNLAVSRSQHPVTSGTSDWYFYRFDVTQNLDGHLNDIDYPGLAVDAQALYVTHNLGWFDHATHGRFLISVLNKADLIAGANGAGTIANATGNGFTVQPASVIGANSPGDVAYFAEFLSSTAVRLWALSDPLGTRQLSSTIITVPDNGGGICCAPQSGTTSTIATLSPQAQGNAFWFAGSVWFCVTAGGSSGRAQVYYYKINSNNYPSGTPTLSEAGNIDGGPGVWTYQPAIGGNPAGDVCLVYSQSSATTLPSIMYTARAAGTAGFETPTSVKLSASINNSGHWGDYATVAVNPTDWSFWICHEWMVGSGAGDWGTWWAQVQMPGRDIYVNWNAPNPSFQDGSATFPYTTVGAGYARIALGTLSIFGGDYNETVRMNKPIRLESYDGIPVVIGRP